MTHELGPTDDDVARMRVAVMEKIAVGEKKRKHRRIGIASVVALSLVAGTAAAVVVTQASTRQQNNSIECYSMADLSAQHVTTAYTGADRQGNTLLPLENRVSWALEICAAVQEQGGGNGQDAVPNPTVCQLSDGRLAVLPNTDDLSQARFCGLLGVEAPTR